MKSIITKNAYLLKKLTQQEIEAKYKGSVLGILWSIFVPLLMLVIYTFVFSEIFSAKWSVDTTNKFEFAMILFCGLASFNMISEVMNRSTNLIIGNTNYVKKVIFPLELLPISVVFAAVFNCIISYLVLIVANAVLNSTISRTVLQSIPAIIPLIVLALGITYTLSALAVYLKDLASVIGIILMLLMYSSPVFFSLEAVPSKFQIICVMNPMTYIIENMRNVILYGENLNISFYIISLTVSMVTLLIGYIIFNRAKEGFADVL